MIYVFLILISVAYITLIGDFAQISLLYMISLIGIMILKAKKTTVLHLCLGLLIFKSIELSALFSFPTSAASGSDLDFIWINTINFSIHLIFDICVLLFLFYRPPISRIYLRWLVFPKGKKHTDQALTYSQAEAWLMGVMFLYFFVDLAALTENFIRNMDYLGISKDIAQYFWNWTLVYHLYTPTKNVLNLLELLAIWLSVSPRGGKKIQRKTTKKTGYKTA